MSKEEVLGYFYTNSSEYGVKTTLLILLCGLAVGMVIYLTYFISSEKIAYNRKFNWSLVTMHLITVVVMLMISSNIARHGGCAVHCPFSDGCERQPGHHIYFLGNGGGAVREFPELAADIYYSAVYCGCSDFFQQSTRNPK